MFYITMPFWILFISYVFTNVIKIKFKQDWLILNRTTFYEKTEYVMNVKTPCNKGS
jgi:hypothetical protein